MAEERYFFDTHRLALARQGRNLNLNLNDNRYPNDQRAALAELLQLPDLKSSRASKYAAEGMQTGLALLSQQKLLSAYADKALNSSAMRDFDEKRPEKTIMLCLDEKLAYAGEGREQAQPEELENMKPSYAGKEEVKDEKDKKRGEDMYENDEEIADTELSKRQAQGSR
ncbi:hypothetical protein CC78DRAFT_586014 [Lojkania enalia]|uniref:Uncharacterized protein n=1 Tax=Lojkania enalia TaxID=147567 RepID=A0A9P4JZJ7_9PLEO|nr:hypothetical protein CC78DRAFT_586014 [Didymosphaeria enalia]